MTEKTYTEEDIAKIIEKSTGLLAKLRSFLTVKEKLTDKMKVALIEGGTGCSNGDRGKVIEAVCEHDTKQDRQRYWFLIGAITVISVLGFGLKLLYDLIAHWIMV